ncbi:HlyD family secretion protein [Celerinatantimonas yamalensis]|uniref:HlyD family secretion protein n=1 Tax=Celerinatantimonas yamalensis TaxID=559956 RepID=A0ABW9G9G5_9GAMM
MRKKTLTADQQFSRWVRRVSILFTIFFVYYLISDIKMPVTPQAMVERPVTQISAEVSGTVTHVMVHNNQVVHAGQLLFMIDPRSYQLALKKAQLARRQAVLTNQQLDASIVAAKADIESAQAVLTQNQREEARIKKLYRQHVVSSSKADQSESDLQTAKAAVHVAAAKLLELQTQRGQLGEDNLLLEQADNQQDIAQLNLSYTSVVAKQNGVVTNLQLQPGATAKVGQPLLAIVADKTDVIADFREKNLRHIHAGSEALVAFDGQPGMIYDAQVTGIDAGVSSGQFQANGLLATPTNSTRWVRDAQRLRVHLKVVGMPRLASGGRATVQLLPESTWMRWIASMQIHAISLLHYVY